MKVYGIIMTDTSYPSCLCSWTYSLYLLISATAHVSFGTRTSNVMISLLVAGLSMIC